MRPLFALFALLTLALGGCLRNRIDLCAMVPPHAECAFLDAGVDAPPSDATSDALSDVPTDAPSDTPADAPETVDAPDAP